MNLQQENEKLRSALREINCADWECDQSASDSDISRLKGELIVKMQRIAADALSQLAEPCGSGCRIERPVAICETMQRPKSECGCPDCGSSLTDSFGEEGDFQIDGIPVRKNEVGDWEYLSQGYGADPDTWHACSDILGAFGGNGMDRLFNAYAELHAQVATPDKDEVKPAMPGVAAQAQDEREAFEAAYASIHGSISAGELRDLRRGDDYAESTAERLNYSWRIWQARASLPVGVPDGWALNSPQ